MTNDIPQFGALLRKVRRERDVSLAHLAGGTYASRGWINNVEAGRRWPAREWVEQAERALGWDGTLLLAWEEGEKVRIADDGLASRNTHFSALSTTESNAA